MSLNFVERLLVGASVQMVDDLLNPEDLDSPDMRPQELALYVVVCGLRRLGFKWRPGLLRYSLYAARGAQGEVDFYDALSAVNFCREQAS